MMANKRYSRGKAKLRMQTVTCQALASKHHRGWQGGGAAPTGAGSSAHFLWITLWVFLLIKGKYLTQKNFSNLHSFRANMLPL
jgi:hypothetical protein